MFLCTAELKQSQINFCQILEISKKNNQAANFLKVEYQD